MSASSLSTLHRALVALTALHLKLAPRAQLLRQHRVTEADLRYYYAEWERLRLLRDAHAQPPSGHPLHGS